MNDHAPLAAATAAERACDPITLEIVRGALRATQGEMEALIERTAMSPFIREKKDFYAALFDGEGRLVVGSNLPIFGDVIGPIVAQYPLATMREGDIYWYNDCYASRGAVSHSPDQVFACPVFCDDEIVAFAQSWAHFNDIGGMRAGSLSPDCEEIFQEGIIVPPVRVARDGQFNDDLLRVFARNSRFPAMVQGDTRASIAAIRLGERRLAELFARFGRERMRDAFAQLVERTRAAVRQRFRALIPPGEYRFADALDSDGQGHGPVTLRYRLTVDAERIELDTTDSDDQVPGPVNFLMSPSVPAAVFASYLLGEGAEHLINAGAEQALDKVHLRPGSVLQPQFPAPLGLRGITLMRHMAVCLGLIATATEGRAGAAAHSAYVIWYLRGRTDDGEFFLMSDGIGVGYGARPFADGHDAVYLVAQENYPAEFLEPIYPVRLRRYAINPDTGGPGRWRGGCGIVREFALLAAEAVISVRIDGIDFPPWGVSGGRQGGAGRCVVNPGRADERTIAPISDGTVLKRGDVVRIETGGGGGFGHPFDREPERVAADVRGGFVGRASAADDYGVLLTSDFRVDEAATRRRRQARPPTALFHRRGYRDRLDAEGSTE
ncbi:MAG TPA: hydantoinase B/oxoprolinase family protein [Stellaceae bacterium]|nr:hydantoinase B/oxoprolinase family protein [Stellaceae bacterium]